MDYIHVQVSLFTPLIMASKPYLTAPKLHKWEPVKLRANDHRERAEESSES
jgi:hypothetical protein